MLANMHHMIEKNKKKAKQKNTIAARHGAGATTKKFSQWKNFASDTSHLHRLLNDMIGN